MHRVEFHRRASKALTRLDAALRQRILAALRELASSPDPATHPNVKALKGKLAGDYRLRVGNYRAIFSLLPEGDCLLVFVTDIGPRGGIY